MSRVGLKRISQSVIAVVMIMIGVVSGPAMVDANTATPAAPAIALDGQLRPFWASPFILQGFDFTQPVTVNFFGSVTSSIYNPAAPNFRYPPANTKPGTYRLTASQGAKFAEFYAYVGTYNPWSLPSTYYTPVGSTVTFNAWDFLPTEQVELFANGIDTGEHQTVGSQALFYDTQGRLFNALAYKIPAAFKGQTLHFTLRGLYSGLQTNDWVTVAN